MTEEDVSKMIQDALAQNGVLRPIKIFGLRGTQEYAAQVARHLDMKLSPRIEKVFEDDESYVKPADGPEGNVRGHNVFVIQSLYSDLPEAPNSERVAEKFMKLCIMCGSLKDASAHEVIAVIPHLAWARQDRKTESRAPITTKVIARMLEAAGANRVLFIDVHNLSAEQNAFQIPTDNLEAKNLHVDWCVARIQKGEKIVILSPDAGGMSRTERFRNSMVKALIRKWSIPEAEAAAMIGIAVFDKIRRNDGNLVGGIGKGDGNIIGDVSGAKVILLDDMISTAGTVAKAANAVPKFGGEVLAICATHGLFVGNANEKLAAINCPIVVADTIPTIRLNAENRKKVDVVYTTKMVSDAIWRVHTGSGSISDLLR